MKANFLQQSLSGLDPEGPACSQPFLLLPGQAIPASILSSGGGSSRQRWETSRNVWSHVSAKPARLLPGSQGPVWAPFDLTFHQTSGRRECQVPEDAPSEFLQPAAHGRSQRPAQPFNAQLWSASIGSAPSHSLSAATGAEWIYFVGLWCPDSQQRQRAENRSHGTSLGFYHFGGLG